MQMNGYKDNSYGSDRGSANNPYPVEKKKISLTKVLLIGLLVFFIGSYGYEFMKNHISIEGGNEPQALKQSSNNVIANSSENDIEEVSATTMAEEAKNQPADFITANKQSEADKGAAIVEKHEQESHDRVDKFSYGKQNDNDRIVETAKPALVVNVASPTPADAHRQEVKKDDEDNVFIVVDQMPSFKGNVNQWLSQNITYPAEAAEKRIEGRVIAKFIVEKDGSISNVQVVRSVHPLLDKQAVDVLMRMPKWNPGKNNGQPARIWFTLPVNFRLQ